MSLAVRDQRAELGVGIETVADAYLAAHALRALLRVYGDLRSFENIALKIFLREDIWKRIF